MSGQGGRAARELDRLCELANVGAGHASGALGRLLGVPVRMEVPRLVPGAAPGVRSLAVCFEVEGGLGGRLVVLFPEESRMPLLGAPPAYAASEPVESALAELGNILASHALSAVAELLGARVVPSVPHVLHDWAAGPLAASPGAIRIETPLVDAAGTRRAVLLWLPDPPPAASDAPAPV